ncbi:uncharacterized protein METZ01_LOCUS61569 [marine metagenome]|uniref:Uncharacterized protein n=1 Tax=marine metagenome TaxID=408172 RepID=A0A381SXG8_9ZZZZ
MVIVSNYSFGQTNDSIPDIDYKRFGPPYYPEVKLVEEDSLKWPMVFDVSMDFKDIKDLDVKNNFFIGKFVFDIYSKYDLEYNSINGDSLDLSHPEWVQLYLKESEIRYFGPLVYARGDISEDVPLFYDDKFTKSSMYVENEFDHSWDLGNYPFDTQKLLFEFQSTVDTSLVKIQPSWKYKSTFEPIMRNLTEGYLITDVTYRTDYKTSMSTLLQISPDLKRPEITQNFIVELNIKRKGGVLFFKIFTGGILSYFISCMVFLIPLRELESRINLAVGGIFGAIGSSAFVYEVLPVVNVFTKADAINNLIIGMVVFNILILLLQQGTFKRINVDGKYLYKTNEIKWFRNLQDSKFSFFYSIFVFFVILGAILLW